MFYVYAYCDPSTGTPFYIGKGQGNRKDHHVAEAMRENSTDRNLHKLRKIRKIITAGAMPEIVIVDECQSERYAFALESHLIKEIGRSDLGVGPLTNLTDGGEGLSGLIRDLTGENNPNFGRRGKLAIWWGRKHLASTKEKISAAQRGRKLSESQKVAMRKPKSEAGRANIAKARLASSYRPSAETKAKLSVALKGRTSPRKGCTQSAEERLKKSLTTRGIPKPKAPCIHCGLKCAANTLKRFHMDNCKERTHAH